MKKSRKASGKSRRVRLPRENASYDELDKFFERHDGVELIERGIMEIDPDREDLERILVEGRRGAAMEP